MPAIQGMPLVVTQRPAVVTREIGKSRRSTSLALAVPKFQDVVALNWQVMQKAFDSSPHKKIGRITNFSM